MRWKRLGAAGVTVKESRMSRDDARIAREEIAHCLDTPMRYWLWYDDWLSDDERTNGGRFDRDVPQFTRSPGDYDYTPVNQRIARARCPICYATAVYTQSAERGLSPMPHASPRGLCRGVRIAGLTLSGPPLRACVIKVRAK